MRRAYLDYQAAKQQLDAAEVQLRAAQLALQTSQQRYNVGAATLLEVTQARATQLQAASALVTARYGLLFQRTLIGYYTGDLNPTERVDRLAGILSFRVRRRGIVRHPGTQGRSIGTIAIPQL